MNKWKEVANLLGLELEEEFYIEGSEQVYKFTNKGVRGHSPVHDNWFYGAVLDELIDGNCKIIKKPWKPKKGDTYWCYYCHDSITENDVYRGEWTGTPYEMLGWLHGNCFRTKEEALTKGKEIVEKIKEEYENA